MGRGVPNFRSMNELVTFSDIYSAGEVSLSEQSGGGAQDVLWKLGMSGMTVFKLAGILEKLSWEQELRLLKTPGRSC